jgi:glycosyltransferase involved in cell wall biosynthesis
MSIGDMKYVLVTPARNEAAFIEGTIKSVVMQTMQPLRWVIVSDGSTDGTDEIVANYASKHSWIELFRMPEHRDRHFAAKAHCFNAGYERIKHLAFDLIASLDADITFEADYFEFLIQKFVETPDLGVAGTPFVEDFSALGHHSYAHGFANLQHVSGACQLFRRTCFDTIGGYVPIKGGAIDWIAVTTARMKGWKTRTFLEKTSLHHRPMGTGNGSRLMSRFRHGIKDYYVGGHPLWEFFRGLFQMREKPYAIGGLFLIAGYFWAWAKRLECPVPADLKAFHRKEQMERMQGILRKFKFPRRKGATVIEPDHPSFISPPGTGKTAGK